MPIVKESFNSIFASTRIIVVDLTPSFLAKFWISLLLISCAGRDHSKMSVERKLIT